MKKYNLAIIFCGIILNSFSQNIPLDTAFFSGVDSAAKMYFINPHNRQSSFADVLNKMSSMLSPGTQSSFTEFRSNTDDVGFMHKKYQQYYNSIPVYGGVLILHANNNSEVFAANGDVMTNFGTEQVSISSDDAINTAITLMNDTVTFPWNDTTYENAYKREKEDDNATTYPTSEIQYFPSASGKLIPVYKVLMRTAVPFNVQYLYINASDGSLAEIRSAITTELEPHKGGPFSPGQSNPVEPPQNNALACGGDCFNGQGNTLFYGTQYINSGEHKFNLDCKYRLKDGCNSPLIYTRTRTHISTNSGSGTPWEITDQTTFFNFLVEEPGVTAHWGLEMSLEYYRNTFSRNSSNGAGLQINGFINDNSLGTTDNAFYLASDDSYNFGSGGGTYANYPIVCLDVVGHELTHGVSRYEAAFDAYGEPGALDESFSDIFGAMIENYAKSIHSTGVPFSYVHGNESFKNILITLSNGQQTNALRDMTNPDNTNDPDTYHGTNWINTASTTVDAGGRHENAMVQDFWFYLLAEGGSGVNDNGDAYCVKGIGKDKAIRITYNNLTNYMSTYAGFYTSRAGSYMAASTLYGPNSNEAAQVIAAWYAVGVGTNYSGPILIANHTATGVENYAYNNEVQLVNFTALSGSNVTVTSGIQVSIEPQFAADNGSVFSAYITPACPGGARVAGQTSPTLSPQASASTVGLQNSGSANALNTARDFALVPNPNNGSFVLTLNNRISPPEKVLITDVLGNVIRSVNNPEQFELSFELGDRPAGIYFVQVLYPGQVISKKMLKN